MKKSLIFICVLFTRFVYSQNGEDSTYQTNVIHDNLPSFYNILQERLKYPLSWLSGNFSDFDSWHTMARAKVKECLLRQPPFALYNPVVIATQDRGSYIAQKVVFNLSADSRVLAYLLVPKGKGPFPAVLLLHDHGARFDIGKEKMVEPFADSLRRVQSAREWVDRNYGGRFIGDELAKRGYVCLAIDALNWSDRGSGGYEGQQAIASNLLNMGMSYAGLIAWEDINAAEFLATRPEVDSTKVIALGFSMGSFRAWQVAALSDRVAAGVAICWMGTYKGLIVPKANATRGGSVFTTTHPGLANYLDYPDVASIACPKPMLFFNGEQDKLFPRPVVQEAYARMHAVWKSQGADDKLITKFWNLPHVFDKEMQDEVFQWLDKVCKK
ncbi:MAG: alpha/beta fold hydrolase [Bacteroidota bacterium]